MGKPLGAVENLYEVYEYDGVTVWIDSTITDSMAKELRIGYKKFFFFGELTLSGINSQVFVR